MPTGVHFQHKVLIDGGDVAGITLAGATIDYGLKRDGENPTPASAYMTLISADALPNIGPDYPGFSWGAGIPSGFLDVYEDVYEGGLPRINLGTSVQINAITPTGFNDTYTDTYDGGFESTRFTGYITAIDVLPAQVNITAITAAEALTRILVDPSGWPEDPETVRITRIAAASASPIDVVGASTATIAAMRVEETPQSAWALLTALAASTDAILYTNREGSVTYRTRADTTGSTTDLSPLVTLLDGLQMTTEIGAVVNSVTVEYGPADTRVKVTVEDAESITVYGKRDTSVATVLADVTDATAKAQRDLDHYKDPVWYMPAVTINLRLAETQAAFPSYLQQILVTDLDDSVTLPDLLPAWPMESYTSRVLGWHETLDPYFWTLTFSLNPAGWTKP
jgi:hypothetical protein